VVTEDNRFHLTIGQSKFKEPILLCVRVEPLHAQGLRIPPDPPSEHSNLLLRHLARRKIREL